MNKLKVIDILIIVGLIVGMAWSAAGAMMCYMELNDNRQHKTKIGWADGGWNIGGLRSLNLTIAIPENCDFYFLLYRTEDRAILILVNSEANASQVESRIIGEYDRNAKFNVSGKDLYIVYSYKYSIISEREYASKMFLDWAGCFCWCLLLITAHVLLNTKKGNQILQRLIFYVRKVMG